MLDKKSSLRISLLRFPLIVGVVFIHAYGNILGFGGDTVGVSQTNYFTDFTQNLISRELARTAVPIFFLLSGYLFFVGLEWSKDNYLKKVKSRIKTLLIPFLFWNIAALLLYAIGQALPATRDFFVRKQDLVANFGAFDYIRVIFGIGRSPILLQFWFIRDLMLLVLWAPIIYYLNKLVPLPFLILLFFCWFLGVWPVNAPRVEGALYFSVGSYLAFAGKSLFALDKYGKVIAAAYVPAVFADIIFFHADLNSCFHKVCLILGVLTVLFATKSAANTQTLKQALLSLGTASFFIFAAHEPLQIIARKMAYKIIRPESTYVVLALYLVIPILVIAVLVAAYRILSVLFPKFTRIITGGR
jgi:surface polysaccharide O-acyltransferase-like enzyme